MSVTFEPWMIWSCVSILVLLLLSGFFSGSETALTAVSKARMLTLEKERNKAAGRVNHLIEDRESLIGAILLGNNLVNIMASSIAAAMFLVLFGEAGVPIATLVMTALVLIFSEVMPKTYALSNPDRLAMAVSLPIRVVVTVFSPIVAAVQLLVRGVLRLLGANVEGPVLSAHEEIRGHIEMHAQEGGVVKGDRDMLGGVLDLRELTVDDVMVHRKNLVMLDIDQPVGDLVDAALTSPHTRLPLYQEDAENIVGILHVRDLARALHEAGGSAEGLDIRAIAREPWFVPETTELLDQLNAFRAKREHFALAVDEYGALMGVVTLEDIIEEIVGEIEDEYDEAEVLVEPLGESSWRVDARLPVDELSELVETPLPDEEWDTVGGLLFGLLGHVARPGEQVAVDGVRLTAERVKGRRIAEVLVDRGEAPGEEGA